MICGSGGSKSGLAKAAGAEPARQIKDEKLHAIVARSKFGSENVQNTSASEHFWKLRCRKSARGHGSPDATGDVPLQSYGAATGLLAKHSRIHIRNFEL